MTWEQVRTTGRELGWRGWRVGSGGEWDRHRDKASDPTELPALAALCRGRCRGSHSWAESREPHSGTHDLKWPSMCSHGLCSSETTLVTHTFLLPRNTLASALGPPTQLPQGRVGVWANSGLHIPPDTHSTCARPRGYLCEHFLPHSCLNHSLWSNCFCSFWLRRLKTTWG